MSSPSDPFERIFSDLDAAAEGSLRPAKDQEEAETVEMLCDAIARFAERHVDPERIDADHSIPKELIQQAAEMGLFGISIPTEFGGAGLSMCACCKVVEALGMADTSLGVTIGLHAGLGLRGLVRLAPKKLQERTLPRLATGEDIACFCITESEAGSDIASVRTTAIQDGDELLVNGSKIFVTNGAFANVATTVVRSPGLGGSRRGHSMIFIPLNDRPGVTRDAEENKLGIRGTSTCSLHFEDLRIPIDHVIGEPGKGLDNIQHVLTWGRTLMAAGCIGLAQVAYDKALAQSTQRIQFKRRLAEFGMVREMLAGMRFRLHAMECLIRVVTRLEDQDPESIIWESSVAKIFCTEAAWQVIDDSLQLHGGSGFIEETGVARLLRDCRVTRIFEGANEVLRFHLASALFAGKQGEISTLAAKLDSTLSEPAKAFDALRAQLNEAVALAKKKHGLRIFKRQMVQHRLADAAINLYTMQAVLIRAQGELGRGSFDDEAKDLCLFSCHELRRRVEISLDGQDDNADELASNLAVAACASIGEDLEEKIV
ncbi:MAG: acyl-CoA dehydrogenase family protein [Deltaproteobacteria bacterium]|nr:acyl-CoA dehydrogenase family protein [Deltaproteobacteria bacterium]